MAKVNLFSILLTDWRDWSHCLGRCRGIQGQQGNVALRMTSPEYITRPIMWLRLNCF